MKVEGIELIRANLPLVSPFRTSFGTEHEREVLLLRVVTDHADGWAECVALVDPVYSSEYVQGAIDVLRRLFIPSLPAMTNINANSLGSHTSRDTTDTRWQRQPWRWPSSTPSSRAKASHSSRRWVRLATVSRAACLSASWIRSQNCSTPWRATLPRAIFVSNSKSNLVGTLLR